MADRFSDCFHNDDADHSDDRSGYDYEREIANLTEQMGGTLLTDDNFAPTNVEPLFAVAPIDQLSMDSEQVRDRLLARFRPSELAYLLKDDPGFIEWRLRAMYNQSSVGHIGKSLAHALAAYLEEFMWMETRVPDPKRSGAIRPPFVCEAVIGLSPQGYAAALDPQGGLWYTRLSLAELPDPSDAQQRAKLWTRHLHCFRWDNKYMPVLRNIEHDTVSLIYDEPVPMCVLVPLTRVPTGDTLPQPIVVPFDQFGPSCRVDYVVSTSQYAIMLDAQGAVGIYSVTQQRLLTRSFIALGDRMITATLPSRNNTAAAAPVRFNPVSGAPLVDDDDDDVADAIVDNAASTTTGIQIHLAFFNELEPNSFILCARDGSMFFGELPEDDIPQDRDLDLATEFKLRKHDIIFAAELKEAKGDAPISDLPMREEVLCACYRSKRGSAPDPGPSTEAVEDEKRTKYMDELVVHGSKHALLASVVQLDYPIQNQQSRDLLQQSTPHCIGGYNCVAALGTAVIAHERGGGLFVFSMLAHRGAQVNMPDMTSYMPTVPVDSGYRSLYVTSAQIFCLLPDGRLFCAV